jgi:adenylate cyclase
VRGFSEALALFRAQRWDEASAAFTALLERHPGDGPSGLYVARCRAFAASPPPANWAGVTVMDTK